MGKRAGHSIRKLCQSFLPASVEAAFQGSGRARNSAAHSSHLRAQRDEWPQAGDLLHSGFSGKGPRNYGLPRGRLRGFSRSQWADAFRLW